MRRYSRYRSPFKLKLRKQTIAGISSVLFLVSSTLLLVSFFIESAVLSLFRQFFSTVFGWATFVFAIIGLLLSLTILKVKWRFAQFNVVFGATLFLLASLALTNLISDTSSGLLAKTIWDGASSLLTAFGAAIVFLGLGLVGLVIMFNTSLSQAVLTVTASLAFIKKIILVIGQRRRTTPIVQPGPIIKGTQPAQVGKLSSDQTKLIDLPEETVTNLPTEGRLWQLPPLSLLSDSIAATADRGDLKQNATIIEKTLDSFGIQAKVVEVNLGPAVTQYALAIPLGTKISKITALQNDLALVLAAPTGTVRIEAPIPGKSLIGIEIPNRTLEIVSLKSILSSEVMQSHRSKLAVALGLDVSGNPLVADITKMPHVLMAGTTGSGKSVCINAFIASLLFRNSPNELKLLLVDPNELNCLNIMIFLIF